VERRSTKKEQMMEFPSREAKKERGMNDED
jgi:hypothetical protein